MYVCVYIYVCVCVYSHRLAQDLCFDEVLVFLKISTSLRKRLAVETHLADGEFFFLTNCSKQMGVSEIMRKNSNNTNIKKRQATF